MKVLQVTTSSKGGAGIAALRLHYALRASGISSGFLSTDLTIDFDGEVVDDTFFKYKKASLFIRTIRKVRSLILPSEEQKMRHKIRTKESKLSCEVLSLPFSNFDLHTHPLVKDSSLVNLHMASVILDYQSFFSQFRKPIVWTLHDLNPFMGLFHYRNDDEYNGKFLTKLNSKVKKIKASSIAKIRKGAIIAPSEWVLEEAENSKVFNHLAIRKCIPNAIDFGTLGIQDSEALRKQNGIGIDDFVLLFISDKLDNRRKGFDLLLDALPFLDKMPMTILTVGEGEIKNDNRGLKIVSLGRISSFKEMAASYGMADVFVMPSREDNLPNVMLESFACGTPVVSFAIGGMKEHIKENFNGLLADEISGKSLAEAIQKVYARKDDYDRSIIREYAEENFNFQKQAEAYTLTYRELLK